MNGARIGITGARRAAEQAALVTSLGGTPVVGPCIDVDRPSADADVMEALQRALAAPCDITVFTTGVGVRHLMDVADRHEVGDAFRHLIASSRSLVRGAKARRALRQVDLDADWMADPADSAAILAEIQRGPVADQRILVQCSGPETDVIVNPLRAAGVDVIDIHPYGIALPPDDLPGLALIRESAAGTLAAVTFTSAHAVHGFMALAERAGIDHPVADGIRIVSIGHVTTAALLSHDLRVDLEPETSRMGAMFQALATDLAERPPRG